MKEVLLAQISELQVTVSKLDREGNLRQRLEASKKEVSEQSHRMVELDCLMKETMEFKMSLERKFGEKEEN